MGKKRDQDFLLIMLKSNIPYFETHQILHNVQYFVFGCLHTILGSLDHNLVTVDPCAREADRHSTKVVSYLTDNFTSASNKVAVVFGGNTDLHFLFIILFDQNARILSLQDIQFFPQAKQIFHHFRIKQ